MELWWPPFPQLYLGGYLVVPLVVPLVAWPEEACFEAYLEAYLGPEEEKVVELFLQPPVTRE